MAFRQKKKKKIKMAAPAQQEKPSPAMIGQAFAEQYYTVLHQSPAVVYRFYQDVSKLGRPQDSGNMGLTTGMDAINAKIQSYGRLKAEITSVDAQESYKGGVIVLITGHMVEEDEKSRSFNQTFFLAPQEVGYFVLNDMFRYMEDGHSQKENEELTNSLVVLNTSEQGEGLSIYDKNLSLNARPAVLEEASEKVGPIKSGDIQVGSNKNKMMAQAQQEKHCNEKAIKAKIQSYGTSSTKIKFVDAQESYGGGVIVLLTGQMVKEDDKCSSFTQTFFLAPQEMGYFVLNDIFRYVDDGNSQRENEELINRLVALNIAGQVQHHQVNAATATAFVTKNTVSSSNVIKYCSQEGEGFSIYVKNLPLNATLGMLEEAFNKFGPIKSGGIQIRSNEGFCVGFVEFEVPYAAQNAIEAASVVIGGWKVGIEEKKPTICQVVNLARGGSHGRKKGYESSESSRIDCENRVVVEDNVTPTVIDRRVRWALDVLASAMVKE